MEPTLNYSVPQQPRFPRSFMGAPLSAREITIERLVFETEVQATRPSHILALAGALAALGGAS